MNTTTTIPEGFGRCTGSLLRSSERAVLVNIDGTEHWLPKSQTSLDEGETFYTITIPIWLATKRNIKVEKGPPDVTRRPSGDEVDPDDVTMPEAVEGCAFNGTYTASLADGSHKTFRVRTQKRDATFAPGQRTIAYLMGSDNETDYQGIGFVDVVDGNTIVRPWKKHRDTPLAKLAQRVLAYADVMATEGIDQLDATQGDTAGVVQLQRSAKCIVCNRRLTDPTSIATGIGPICAGRE